MSKWYDLFSSFERKYRREGFRKLNLKSKEKVLEVGFGTGRTLVKIAKKIGEDGFISGIDISEGMIKKAQKRIIKSKIQNNISLICGDATFLPFKDDTFNAVFICFTIELFSFEDIKTILLEVRRVLDFEGRICIVNLSTRKTNLITKIYNWFHKKIPRIVDCRPIDIKNFLDNTTLKIIDNKEMMMWGLPVDIVVVKKK